MIIRSWLRLCVLVSFVLGQVVLPAGPPTVAALTQAANDEVAPFEAPTANDAITAVRASPAVTHTLFLPLVVGPAFTLRPPNPLDLTMSLDSSRAATATLPLSGGYLTTTSANGDEFALAVPPNALLYTTTVVMTPISTVIGLSPTVQFIAGVHLEPEGLRLFNLATLTVTPSISVPITKQVAFGSHALGQSAYLYPLQRGTPQVVFSLMHFSDYSLAQSEVGPIPVQFDPNHVPVLPEEQYQQEAAQLVNQQRSAELSGQPGDPNFAQKLELLSRGYYENVLVPKLKQAVTDCQNAQSLLLPAIGWSRQMQLMGFGDAFASEISNIFSKALEASQNCWNKIKCVHWNFPPEVEHVLSLARQVEMLGGTAVPGSLPECPCVTITSKPTWTAQVNIFYDRTAYGSYAQMHLKQNSNVTAQLAQLSATEFTGGISGGGGNVSFAEYASGGLVAGYQGGPLVPFTPPNQGSHVILYLNPQTCMYLLWAGVTVTVTDSLDGTQYPKSAGTFVGGQHPLSDFDTQLSGGVDAQAHSSFYISQNGGKYADFVEATPITNLGGEFAGGTAQVSWTLTPGP